MIHEAWKDGNRENKPDKAKINWRKKLEDYAEHYSQKFLNKHDKEGIKKIVKNMGKKEETSHCIAKYMYFDSENKYKNLMKKCTNYDQCFEECNFSFIWKILHRKISINLEELTEDEDYCDLYIRFSRGSDIITGSNDSLVILDLLGITSKKVDAICINLVVDNLSTSGCNIM